MLGHLQHIEEYRVQDLDHHMFVDMHYHTHHTPLEKGTRNEEKEWTKLSAFMDQMAQTSVAPGDGDGCGSVDGGSPVVGGSGTGGREPSGLL